MIIEPIAGIGGDLPAKATNAIGLTPRSEFQQLLAQPLESVNQALLQADAASMAFATGETTALHDVMLTIEHARLSLQLAVEVRNRAVEAYQELMRMQL